ncbi:MAG: amidohydrolase [candidate division WOR-3 bacterium]
MIVEDAEKIVKIEDGKIREIYKKGEIKPDFIFKKASLIPSFCDSHTHLIGTGLSEIRYSLKEKKSKEEVYEFLKEILKEKKDLIIAYDFDESKWKEKEFPKKEELDKISKKVPIILRRICGHFAVGNSRALEILKLKKAKNIDFETGIMKEEVPLNLNYYFPPSKEEIKKAFIKGQEIAFSFGITEVHEILGLKNFKNILEFKEKDFLIRINLYVVLKNLKEIREFERIKGKFEEKEFLKLKGIKIFADGSIGARTAFLKEDYSDAKGERGKLLIDEYTLTEFIKYAEKKGLQLLVHAIGDAAIEFVLKTFNKMISKNPLRHRIEHFEIVNEDIIKMAKKSNIYISMQPNFVREWQEKNGMYYTRLGEKRWKKMNLFKTLLNEDLKIAFGSDCMPIGPLYGIKGAMNHPIPSQRINFETSLKLYTENPRIFSFEEKNRGKIKKDFDADLILLDKKNNLIAIIFKDKITYTTQKF